MSESNGAELSVPIGAHVVPLAAYPSAGGSLSDEVSVTLWRMLAPGLFRLPAGSFVSRCHVHVSGVASVLPAGSVARTSKVCRLSVRPLTLCGLVHGANEPPSIRHSKVEPVSEEQSVLWFEHSKNCTWETPLPLGSLAVAVKLVGLGREPLIAVAGAVIETDGGTLSTRMLVFSSVVLLDASSVARARRS